MAISCLQEVSDLASLLKNLLLTILWPFPVQKVSDQVSLLQNLLLTLWWPSPALSM